MIYARDYDSDPNGRSVPLGVRHPDKERIAAFMRSHEYTGVSEGYIRDYLTGAEMDMVDGGVRFDNLFWRGEDLYNFVHNDMELNPEFCARVLELAGAGR